jgi:hypothetical protein
MPMALMPMHSVSRIQVKKGATSMPIRLNPP